MRCTLGFFGLNRSLRYTSSSIQYNIYRPLREAGLTITRIGHFNTPAIIHSPRSGEWNLSPPDHDLNALELDYLWNEPQHDETIAHHVAFISDVPWRNEPDEGGFTRRNALWQLHSLRRLRMMIRNADDPTAADFYVLLRPDLEYLDALPIDRIVSSLASGVDLITPDWETHEGLNDRFAVCSRAGLTPYCTRIAKVKEMVGKYGYLHSETLLLHAAEAAALTQATMPMRARRVRATGVRMEEDFPA